MIFTRKPQIRLLVAGPVNISKDLKKFNPFPEIGHRETEFTELYKSIKEKLYNVFDVEKEEFDFAIIGGSGTAALETMITSTVTQKILVISNGAFGERAYEIARIYRLPRTYLRYEWGTYPDINEIEKILQKNPDIGFVYMVHMETSTGMLNPVQQVGELCRKYNKTYLVDSVCAICGEELDMNKFNIDFCAFSSNKGIGGPAVIGMVCCRKSKLKNLQKRNMYLNLETYLKYGKINQTPFTPAINMIFTLNETLRDLLKEGLYNRRKRYTRTTNILRGELGMLGLDFYISNTGRNMSHCLTNVLIPTGFTFDYIHDEMKKRGFIIYAGKGELNGKVMHLATMGALTEKDIKDFIKNLKEVLK